MNVSEILHAMRADAIPEGDAGLFHVRKQTVPAGGLTLGKWYVEAGQYTSLLHWTEATLHLSRGECVMVDHEPELRTHLDFVMHAHGRVLITGLGLGCVLRGVLMRADVTHVDVVERSRHVMDLVAPYLPTDPRVRLHHADARVFPLRLHGPWDFGWHDLWSNPDRGDPHLQVIHAGLLVRCRQFVAHQGAWAFPRPQRRLWRLAERSDSRT